MSCIFKIYKTLINPSHKLRKSQFKNNKKIVIFNTLAAKCNTVAHP